MNSFPEKPDVETKGEVSDRNGILTIKFLELENYGNCKKKEMRKAILFIVLTIICCISDRLRLRQGELEIKERLNVLCQHNVCATLYVVTGAGDKDFDVVKRHNLDVNVFELFRPAHKDCELIGGVGVVVAVEGTENFGVKFSSVFNSPHSLSFCRGAGVNGISNIFSWDGVVACRRHSPAVARCEGSNSNMGVKKSANDSASSRAHSYFSAKTSTKPHGLRPVILRNSPLRLNICDAWAPRKIICGAPFEEACTSVSSSPSDKSLLASPLSPIGVDTSF
uniref:Uncharacterized protein n=1 Tax=Glossina palpalis gambiensis TaxID=67801 RepID=A0A1B0BI84_9MUSC